MQLGIAGGTESPGTHSARHTGAPSQLTGVDVAGYTLGTLVGRGGMGSVWRAERSDGRFEGLAAVKMLAVDLLGQGGEARFRREGTILARLSHPSIARLLDAGLSSSGQPFLVLEYVDGEHIDRYCDQRQLDVEARLGLFLAVLEGVAHAHANLIVHRDIKPSNVLVAADGRVKLLDFGIAKLLADEDPRVGVTALTREGACVLTPLYASPEQLTGRPVTTATDVHALGLLLYVLLSGRHPFAAAQRSPAELMEAIVETEAGPLEGAVAHGDAPETDSPEVTARKRGTTAEKLARTLAGDLSTIVARALKKAPDERYATATALADDLRRYLTHQPIAARPDSVAYRTRKFVRRNRVAVALTALAAAALIVGLVGTLTQATRAEAQRARADHAARDASDRLDFALRELSRAEALNELNAFLLSDAAPSGQRFTARELLDRAHGMLERQQAGSDENRVEMLVAIGRQYESLDEEGKAKELLSSAYERSRQLRDRAIRAKASIALAGPLATAGEFDRAKRLIDEALTELGEEPQFALHRVSALLRASYVAREAGEVEAAVKHVLAAQQTLSGSGQGSDLLELRLSMALAESYRMAGRNREASSAFEKAFARLSGLGRERTELAGTLLNNWGLALQLLGRPLDAEALFRQAVAISAVDGTGQGVSPMLLNNLARTLFELYRLDEAAETARRAYAAAAAARHEIVINQALAVRFAVQLERHDEPGARALLAELVPRYQRMMPAGHIAFALVPMYEALLAMERGERDAAVSLADRAIALTEANPQRLDYLPTMLLRRATVALQFNRASEARADAERALAEELKAVEPGALSSSLGRSYLILAHALDGEGRRDEAVTMAATALPHLQERLGADHPRTRAARELVASGTRVQR